MDGNVLVGPNNVRDMNVLKGGSTGFFRGGGEYLPGLSIN